MMRPDFHKLTRIAVMVAALSAASVSMVAAQSGQGGTNGSQLETTTSTRAPTGRINLLSAPREGAPVVRVRQMGRGSWICSPAGFGQRSRCYRN